MRKGGIATVYLNRPKKFNGLSLPMFRAIEETALSLKNDPDVRAVVLAGRGRVFCAGLDVSSMMSFQFAGNIKTLLRRESGRVDNLAQSVGYLWRDLDVPVIAALHGVCFGGGFQIAMGADVRFAAPNTRFSIMEAKWGLIPDMSGSVTFRELVPMSIAKKLTFTGEVFDTTKALNYGFVSPISDEESDVVEHAVSYAESLSISSPDEARSMKQRMLRDRENRYRDSSVSRVDTAFDVTLPSSSFDTENDCYDLYIGNNIAQLEIADGDYANVSAACNRIARDRNVRVLILNVQGTSSSSSEIDPQAMNAADDLRRLAIPVLGVIQGEQCVSNLALCLGSDIRFSDTTIHPDIETQKQALMKESSVRMRMFESLGDDVAVDFLRSENPVEDAFGYAKTIFEKSPDSIAYVSLFEYIFVRVHLCSSTSHKYIHISTTQQVHQGAISKHMACR